MEKTDIDRRIIEYITYLTDIKVYKSEAEYLRTVGMASTKISEVRKGKVSFRPDEIRNILINSKTLNAHWIMTGEGTMFQQEENKDISLAYAIDRCRQLEKENKELLLQVGELTGRIKEIKKDVPKENNATCADASGSDLEK
uniref:hypothetical protein n=1 Tax=Bacteroides stercoris TaxID=46506 RepID=UPI0040252F52